MIRNPYPGPDHHQKLTTSRGSPLAHAYHVWSTSVTAIVSYPAHRMTERPITLLCQPWRSKNFKRFVKQSYVSNFDCSSLSEEFSALRLIQDGADLSVYEWISDSARRRKANRWRNVWRSNDTGLSRLSASAAQPLSTAHNEAQRDDRPRNPTRTSNLHGAFSNLVIRPGRDKIWSLVCDVAGQLWGGERVCATSCFNDIISSFSRPLSVTQTIPYTKSRFAALQVWCGR